MNDHNGAFNLDMYDPSDDNQTKGSVSLIASGYEWTCPTCDHLNREIEIVEEAECANCGAQYDVDIANHAY